MNHSPYNFEPHYQRFSEAAKEVFQLAKQFIHVDTFFIGQINENNLSVVEVLNQGFFDLKEGEIFHLKDTY